MECGEFHPKYSAELLEHVDKQNEVLVEAYNSMLHELQKIRVEEEMLMRKLYEVLLTKQNDCNTNNSNSSAGAEHSEHSNEEVNAARKEQ